MSVHVYPINDEKPHTTDGSCECWCKPRVVFQDPDTGEILEDQIIVHNSADCREIVEEAERILAKASLEL